MTGGTILKGHSIRKVENPWFKALFKLTSFIIQETRKRQRQFNNVQVLELVAWEESKKTRFSLVPLGKKR